ncbi:kinesin, putative [Bodo saltans]|uniref:Kinesin, putative n=1 Tax=Bodo saltans TaxID=75058 RepID=A0A0S4IM77_BODSA|nr:kinesin, putative [Bodo saltans]|eukprot:CUE73035.1 kinesin, putative [Bodo saltans]
MSLPRSASNSRSSDVFYYQNNNNVSGAAATLGSPLVGTTNSSSSMPVPPRSRPTGSYQDPSQASASAGSNNGVIMSSPDRQAIQRASSPQGTLVGTTTTTTNSASKYLRGSGTSSEPLVINIDAPIHTPTRSAYTTSVPTTALGSITSTSGGGGGGGSSQARIVARHTATAPGATAVYSTTTTNNVPIVVAPTTTPSRGASSSLGASYTSYTARGGGGGEELPPSFGSPSSPLARANQEVDILRKMLSERESELSIRGEQFRSEQREWAEVLRLNQDELMLSRRTVESLTTELHQSQVREQHTVAQMDTVQQRYEQLQKRSEDREAEVARFHDLSRKRTDELQRLEELCAARAKELSIVTIGRTRGEKRAATLQTELEECQQQLAKLRDASNTKIATLTNHVERLQSELKEANGKHENVLSSSNDAIRQLTTELDRLSQELIEEHRIRVMAEDDRDELRLEREEERTILAQCDTTMTALDDENKSLQESNDALRHNSDRLGGAVQEQTGKLELQLEQIAHLKDINVSLKGELQRVEEARDVLESKLSDVTTRFDAVCDELDGTTAELQQRQKLHTDSMADLQLAYVTLKRQSEEESASLKAQVRTLEQQLQDAAHQLQNTKLEAERRLVQTVSEREVELLRDAAAKRQDLMNALTKEFDSDPRLVRFADMQRQHAELLVTVEDYHKFVSAMRIATARDEQAARDTLEKLAEDFFALFRAASHTIPQQFDKLLQQRNVAEEHLESKLHVVSSALETSTSELATARNELELFRSTPNMDFLVSSRVDVIKSIAEMIVRGRLTRRRLRSLFALASWKLLLKEQLVPDDFGQLLCDIVDDFQWMYDKHRDLATGNFTTSERQQWGIQTNIPGSDDAVSSPLPTIAFPPRSSSMPQQQLNDY